MSDRERPAPRLDTLAVHAGAADDAHGSVVAPIYQAATFDFPAGDRPLVYTRYGNNPTQVALQSRIAALEGAEEALVLASGMATLSTTILSVCEAGDHVVAAPSLYGGTHKLLEEDLPRVGVETDYARSLDPAAWEEARRPNTRLFLWEAITNPLLRVADPAALVGVAHEHGITTLVDATFATPVNQRPLEHGVDLVMHSATKYLGGHSDVIGGAVAGDRARIEGVKRRLQTLGGSVDPHAAFLIGRGIKTLALRVARQNENGAAVAEFLTRHPRVEWATHPTRPDHPDRDVIDRVLAGGGGVVTFLPACDRADAERIVDRLRWIRSAPSLGGVESLAGLPALTSHRSWTSARREEAGFPDPTIRLALGIEAADDLIDDLSRALDG